MQKFDFIKWKQAVKMFYKLSNIAKLVELERQFGIPFEYPSLYSRQPIINGLNEENLSVILMDKPQKISISIWGILPEQYSDDWQTFQHVSNSLNVEAETLKYNLWYGEAFRERRCLVLVTGYFASLLKDGKLYPYYVYLKSKKPFCLAGIYNRLDDGFVTCSIIISRNLGVKRSVEDIYRAGPIILSGHQAENWLSTDLSLEEIDHLITDPAYVELSAHPIAKEFYNNDIIYNGILDPVNYRNIPTKI